jgi:DUF971 family protein
MRAFQSEQHSNHDPRGKANQDGIIVWDQKGVVIMWQDGHRSRFSWQALRGSCACQDCQAQSLTSLAVERNAA